MSRLWLYGKIIAVKQKVVSRVQQSIRLNEKLFVDWRASSVSSLVSV